MSWKSISVIIIWIIISVTQYNRAEQWKELANEFEETTTSVLKTCNGLADQTLEMKKVMRKMQARAVINYFETKRGISK